MSGGDGGPTVLDASAVLAVLHGEPGGGEVEGRLEAPGADARIGAVNLSEVVAKLSERGVPRPEIREVVGSLGLAVVPFGEELAYLSGALRPGTKDRGLSFGDRACVALARAEGALALTMERSWDGLDGVEVIPR